MSHRINARAPCGQAHATSVETAPERVGAVLEDAAHSAGGHAAGLAFPRSEADVSALVRAHRAVLAVGAQSSLTGGATPHGEVVLSTARMASVTDVSDPPECRVRVQPGLSLVELREALDPKGLDYPPMPTFTGATVGGTIATNAAGAATFKYGSTRKWVEAITVVLGTGEVLDIVRGAVHAHEDGYFEVGTAQGVVRVPLPRYRMPDVVKRSAGYYAEPGMDLIDLFLGSEGTLGIVTEAVLRVRPRTTGTGLVFVPVSRESLAFALTAELRDLTRRTWRGEAGAGLDIPAIEYLDARAWSLVPADVLTRAGLTRHADDAGGLFVHVELPRETTDEAIFTQIAEFADRPDTPFGCLCACLARFGVLDRTELALPGDRRRFDRLIDIREAVPTAVNDLVGTAQRTIDGNIGKVGGDVIVPFAQLEDFVGDIRAAFRRAGLDLAIWGHVSDGNLHPNLLPRSAADTDAARDVMLEVGREAIRRGGCPLAEHGVGRNPVKQALLEALYGPDGLNQMRAVKRALDPDWKLAPGVLFPR